MVKALIKATAKKVIKKKKPTPNLPNNYVKVPKKYLNTEQSILKKIDQNKPLTEKQMLNFSQAVKINEIIISLIFIGAINKFVKFLLHISSRNNILKPMLVLNKKS